MEQSIELNKLMGAMYDFARMTGAQSVKTECRFGYFSMELRATLPSCQDAPTTGAHHG